jgi:hypothetical protein
MHQDGDDLRSAGTIIDARERTSRAAWWWLALVALAAVLVLLRGPITAWLAPRLDALLTDAGSSSTEDAGAPAPQAGAAGSAGNDRGADAAALRRAPTAWADEQPAAAASDRAPTPAPDTAPAAPLPRIQPLYPVATSAAPAAPGPAGKAGLVEGLRDGALRPATGADLARWKSRAAAGGNPPARDFDDRLRMFDAYLVRRDFTMPGGLYGANAAVFLLEPGVPYPRGDAGHSAVLDLGSGACIGTLCGMLVARRQPASAAR